ncbi:EF-hand calcium-binding domain-containing protein 6 [Ctenodactylus gundi]
MSCSRTLEELELQLGEEVFRNMKTVIKAFQLFDVHGTGLVRPQELRRVLEMFCLKMTEEEYREFSKHYNIDHGTAVDYNAFLKNLSISNDLNLRYIMANQEISPERQQPRHLRREAVLSSVSSKESWKDYSLEEVERIFCQEFSKCYEKIEKALGAGDPSKCGYVSLNYLKVVLDTFVYQLPRGVFLQLMKRFGLKTTSRINWKQFLTSVCEPKGLEINNAVPLKKRDRRDQNEAAQHLASAGQHWKPDGQITGEELRQILNALVVKLSDSEFRELMRTLDPKGTGVVMVGSFMDLLGEDSKVEERVHNAIARNLHALRTMLQAHDSGDTGLVGRNHFKKIMKIFCPFLTSEHLTKLCCKFQDTASGRILYKKLLACVGTDGLSKASPVLVSKDQPQGHFQEGEAQQPAPCDRTEPTEDKSTMPENMTIEEVIKNLRHCIEQWDPVFRERFLEVSKGPRGKIGVQDFKKVLERSGMPMDSAQFALLTTKIGYKEEGMSYLDFVGGFEGKEVAQLALNVSTVLLLHAHTFLFVQGRVGLGVLATMAGLAVLHRSPTGPDAVGREGEPGSTDPVPGEAVGTAEGSGHLRVAAGFHSKSVHFVTAEECLTLFPRRLKESFQDPYSAFFKIDTDRDGIINIRDLHRLLRQLVLPMKDSEFERFLGLLGLRLSSTLNFREFQNLCEQRPLRMDEAPQRLVRPKQKVADSELACEQAHQYLIIKAKTRWADLSKNFIETDNEGHGILRRRDVKNALYGFDIPLTPREFEKLWQSYDTEGRGYLTYQEFLQKLGIKYSPAVHRPYVEDYFNFLGHFTKPQQMQEELRELQQSAEDARPARDKLIEHLQGISQALKVLDRSKAGSVSLPELRRVLQECGCPLKEEEVTGLLDSWGISCHNNSIDYFDFLRALERSETAGPQPGEPEEDKGLSFSSLRPEEVVKGVQEVVGASQQALMEAFSARDKEDTGFVKATEFGQVLKEFCHRLTDSQYHYLLRKLRMHLTPCIHWKYFLENFGSFSEETAEEWAEKMPRVPPPVCPRETASKGLLKRLRKAVAAHYHAVAQEFKNFDTMETNTVSRDEFKAVCTRHVQILTGEQFDRLWGEMPLDTQGRLKYQEFLSRFCTEQAATPPATGDSVQAQRGSSVPAVSEGTRSAGSSPTRDLRSGLKSRSHPCTPEGALPLQNCQPIESRLRKQVQGCWRELLRRCKEKDVARQGTITTPEFLALVDQFGLDVSQEERQQLALKFDLKGTGTFAYCDFIQSCVLLLSATGTAPTHRMKIQKAHKMKEAGPASSSFYAALLRMQPRILHCWRPMRRAFKACDAGGTGLLSAGDFRKVLRQFSINLSEEEFFHILEYYDKTLSSKISYNDFLRAFLQ